LVRLLLLSYFELDDLPVLLAQVRRAALPRSLPVFAGSYGVNAEAADQVSALPNGRYAPMFQLNEPWYREERRLPPELDPLVPKDYAGAIPRLTQLPTTRQRVAWGTELGSRFRDALRAATGAGASIASWQLDEIGPASARPTGGPLREFFRGVLQGLLLGRPILRDVPLAGFVWVAHSALGLARAPVTPELSSFWEMLNAATLGYVGEEYPTFEGDASAVARAQASGQRALAAGGPVRRALAEKYVAGMTPGYHLASALGGNVHHWARPQVNGWRATYVRERADSGVAGLGEFDFRFGNSAVTVMHDTMSALAAAVRDAPSPATGPPPDGGAEANA
jgi:hypothetical protein